MKIKLPDNIAIIGTVEKWSIRVKGSKMELINVSVFYIVWVIAFDVSGWLIETFQLTKGPLGPWALPIACPINPKIPPAIAPEAIKVVLVKTIPPVCSAAYNPNFRPYQAAYPTEPPIAI